MSATGSIIDLHQTLRLMEDAYNFARETVAGGKQILFVGTKRQAEESVRQAAERCGMPYVNKRWLGGMMTNFRTISQRIRHLQDLEAAEASGEWTRLTKKEVLGLKREHEKLSLTRRHPWSQAARRGVSWTQARAPRRPKPTSSYPRDRHPDTNCDGPGGLRPGNDDTIRAIRLITGKITDAAIGQQVPSTPAEGRLRSSPSRGRARGTRAGQPRAARTSWRTLLRRRRIRRGTGRRRVVGRWG